MTFLQNLPTIECADCNWRLCTLSENVPEMEKLAYRHITDTDGHQLTVNYTQGKQ